MTPEQIALADAWFYGSWPDDAYFDCVGSGEWISNLSFGDKAFFMLLMVLVHQDNHT